MEITAQILDHQVDKDTSATAQGVAEQLGTEIRFEAWRGAGDARWVIRIPGGIEQGDQEVVDTDAMVEAIRERLNHLNSP